MPRSNNPYDLINALEDKYTELSSEGITFSTDINATEDIDGEFDYTEYVNEDVADIATKIVKYHIASEDEIQLVADILGLGRDWTIEMLNSIITARTGYDTIESYMSEVYPHEN